MTWAELADHYHPRPKRGEHQTTIPSVHVIRPIFTCFPGKVGPTRRVQHVIEGKGGAQCEGKGLRAVS